MQILHKNKACCTQSQTTHTVKKIWRVAAKSVLCILHCSMPFPTKKGCRVNKWHGKNLIYIFSPFWKFQAQAQARHGINRKSIEGREIPASDNSNYYIMCVYYIYNTVNGRLSLAVCFWACLCGGFIMDCVSAKTYPTIPNWFRES